MRSKLGFFTEREEDSILIDSLLLWMKNNQADYTNTFLKIQSVSIPEDKLYKKESFTNFMEQWQQRIAMENMTMEKHKKLMSEHNPVYIPRNHQVEAVLKSATENNDYAPFHLLMKVLEHPYTSHAENTVYQEPPSPDFESYYQTFCGT